MAGRRIDGFFYGLFMDPDVLAAAGVIPTNPRMAYADGLALRIGNRATLVAEPGARAYGMVYALMHGELAQLYGAPGLENYRPATIIVRLLDGGETAALCYNLNEPPAEHEQNDIYAGKLREALRALGFPGDYITSIGHQDPK